MRHAYGNAHIHSDGDCDIYCDCDRYSNVDCYSNCNGDRTAAAYTDATASADTAGASRDQLL
jgi:hypothetical protein